MPRTPSCGGGTSNITMSSAWWRERCPCRRCARRSPTARSACGSGSRRRAWEWDSRRPVNSSLGVELREALGERAGGLVRRPRRDLELERLDAVELRPVPALGAEDPALGREQRAVGALDLRHVRLDAEARGDRAFEVVLGGLERMAKRAAVLDRMRHVAE